MCVCVCVCTSFHWNFKKFPNFFFPRPVSFFLSFFSGKYENNKWAHSADITDPAIRKDIQAAVAGKCPMPAFDGDYPLNPFGPTGIRGRGSLPKWGELVL